VQAYDGVPYQVKRGRRSAENMESDNILISTKIRLMKALVWPVAAYACEMKGLRKILASFVDSK